MKIFNLSGKVYPKVFKSKLLFIMRMTLFLSFVLSFSLLGTTIYSQNTRLNLDIKDGTVKTVLKLIEEQSNFRFFYNSDLVDLDKEMSVSFKNKNIDEILRTVLSGTSVGYRVLENNFVVLSSAEMLQQITITGTILDDDGEPMPGVNIMVKGTGTGVVSNINGKFSINVPNRDAILLFSFVGYISQEIPVGNQTEISITLSEDTKLIEEVVVVGYGVQKRVNLTGAVATVDVERELQSRPLTNVGMALSGMAAGVQVMQNSGQPNSDGANIRIRGIGTLNTSTPLVLIDGMESSLGNINPNDIATISILKDAASCAIYGNRGANGVVLITTKQGEKGKINVNYSGTFSFNQPSNLIKVVSNSADYFELMNESSTNIGQNVIFSQQTINEFREAEKNPNGLHSSGYPNYVARPNTDWYKEIFQNKLMQEHSVSVLGGTEKVRFNFSGTYLNNPGLVESTGQEKFYVRSNITANVTDWLQIGNRTFGYQNNVERNNVNTLLTGIGMTKASPCIYPYYNGIYGATEAVEEDAQAENVRFILNSNGGGFTYAQINTSMFANVTLFKDFVYHVNFDWTRYWTEHLYTTKSIDRYSFSQQQYMILGTDVSQLSSMFYTLGEKRWRFEQTLTYNKTFNSAHEVGALVGFEEMKFTTYNVDAQKRGLIDETITDLSTATTMSAITGTNSGYASRSFFGRATYAYDSRYLFEVNLRYDGSSRFSPDSRWGLFPSVSAGWRLSQESFMASSPFSNLKLRASWGQLGNNSIGNYDWQSTYATSNYSFGGVQTPGLAQTALANSRLEWETTTITDLGIDVSILNNRLTAEIDLYNKLTDGILYRESIYATMGNKTAPYQNLAEVTNKGFEVLLGWNDRIDKLSYGLKGNFSFNKNRVTKYRGKLERGWVDGVYKSNLGDVSTGGTNRVVEGRMINDFYTMEPYQGTGTYFNGGTVDINGGPKDGMIRTEQDMEWLLAMKAEGYSFYPNQNIQQAGNSIWYGDYIYADLNGDGIYGSSYDYDFRDYSTNPKYNFGLQAHASWNNFDFSMNWQGSAGFKVYYYTTGRNSTATIYGYLIGQDIAKDHYFYDPGNPNDPRTNLTSKNSRLTRNAGSSQSDATSTLHLEKGDFLKLRNLTIGYTLPPHLAKKIYTQNIRFFVSGENLLTITKFTGMDPESQVGMSYVTMRQLAFGLNVTF